MDISTTKFGTKVFAFGLFNCDTPVRIESFEFCEPQENGQCLIRSKFNDGRPSVLFTAPATALYASRKEAQQAVLFLATLTCAQARVVHRIVSGAQMLTNESFFAAILRTCVYHGLAAVKQAAAEFDVTKFLSGGYDHLFNG